ncbi:class I heat shock protein-like [Telopea speciosissima]|uniref:class I heat shock protein-like n=1 Tax=Telopea speciosissima TaxID=54955 RepID=UPI001CC7E950|nr:class I heat shock protein-like [Telopea speciosissima]
MSIIPSFLGGFWDPFQDFPFSSSLTTSRPQFSSDTAAFANFRVDWKEIPEAHIFKADLPGLKKEEVKVEVEEGRVLQISGERTKEQEEKNDQWHRIERSSGKFLRRFRLPENAKMDQVKASVENGVLTVTIPKEEVKKPEVKAIEISG